MSNGRALITVVDFGVGNTASVLNAVTRLGFDAEYSTSIDEESSGIILPGVGSFDRATDALDRSGLRTELLESVKAGKPILGICLGMQLLFEASEEGAGSGLGLFSGTVRRLEVGEHIRKVPHTGYSYVGGEAPGQLFEKIPEQERRFYFVHAFGIVSTDVCISAMTTCTDTPIVSSIERENIFGTQFHPEKSGNVGSLVLANFLTLTDKTSNAR